MYKYQCLNPISHVGLERLDENYVKTDEAGEADVILVRSATKFAHTCASAVGMPAIIKLCAPKYRGQGGRVSKNHGISQAHQAEKFVRRSYE